MVVVYFAVDEIENVTGQDRGYSHGSPVLGETFHSKSMSHNTRIYTKQHSVRESAEAGDKNEIAGVRNGNSRNLCCDEDTR